ncbi:MAG: glycosyltransferase family 87 protein [Pseudomonadota bacterium]
MSKAVEFFANRYPLLWALVTTQLRTTLWVAALLSGTMLLAIQAYVYLSADGVYTFYGLVIGGDFVVFDTVADAAARGEAAAMYNPDILQPALRERFPGAESEFLLFWAYPPTMLFVLMPAALFPYLASYAVWSISTFSLYAASLVALWRDKLAIVVALTAAVTFQALITGQNGFLTAALIATAAFFAKDRPLLAGLAAGLLTVKPQLGLLIPIAFVAAGCWRAFFTAAVTSIVLAAASFAVFGLEAWTAFFESFRNQNEIITSDLYPFRKMVTAYGVLSYFDAPVVVAQIVQMSVTLSLMAFVAIIWRKVDDRAIRAAALIASIPLATPYALFYELTIFVPAILLITKTSIDRGWLDWEKVSIGTLWMMCFFVPGDSKELGVPFAFIVACLAFFIVARRALPEAGFRFSSANLQPSPGS